MEAVVIFAIITLVVLGFHGLNHWLRNAQPPATELTPPFGSHAQHTANTLIVTGGALLLLAQLTSRVMPVGAKLPTFLLVLAGGTGLLVGLRAHMRGVLPTWLNRPLTRPATFFGVAPAQTVMLAAAPAFAWLAWLAAGDGRLARHGALAVVAWLAAIAFVVAGSWVGGADEPDSRDGRSRFDRWDVALSVLVFAVALALRAYRMAEFPNTYSGDEGSAGLMALDFLAGKTNNPFTIGWFSFPSLYFTVQSAAIALFGQTIEAVRLTSAVAGALAVVALYWLARVMFDRTTAVLAALYLAASHYHIHMSRIALNNVWDSVFGTVAILGLWYGWQSGRRLGFILCGLALGLGQYFYVTIRVLPILFLFWAGMACWRQRALFRQRFAGLASAAFIALIVFMPLGFFFYHHPGDFQAPMNRVTILGDWLESETARGERAVAEIIIDQAVTSALGFTTEPLRLLYSPGSAVLLSWAGVLFVLGLLWALLNFDLRYLLLILPLLATVALGALSQDAPASQRYVLAMPLIALFVALPIGQTTAWLQTRHARRRALIVVAALAMVAAVAALDINYYFNEAAATVARQDVNTRVATEIAYYLRDKEPADQMVYFFGFPRMGYFSLSTIPFLAPAKQAQDVIEPLTGPADFTAGGGEPALFIFLPERMNELEFVRQRIPGGVYREFHDEVGELLFVSYEA